MVAEPEDSVVKDLEKYNYKGREHVPRE